MLGSNGPETFVLLWQNIWRKFHLVPLSFLLPTPAAARAGMVTMPP